MTWAIDQKGYSQRRACRLVGLQAKTYRYVLTRLTMTVRKRGGRKRALGTRAPMSIPQDQNLRAGRSTS